MLAPFVGAALTAGMTAAGWRFAARARTRTRTRTRRSNRRRPVRRPPRTRSPPLPGAGSRVGAAAREPPPGSPAGSGNRAGHHRHRGRYRSRRAGQVWHAGKATGLPGAEPESLGRSALTGDLVARSRATRRSSRIVTQAPPGGTVSASENDYGPVLPAPVPMITRPRQLRETVKACARRGGRAGKLGYHNIRGSASEKPRR